MAEQPPALSKEDPRGLSKDRVLSLHFIALAGRKDRKDFMSVPNPKEHFYFRDAIWQESCTIVRGGAVTFSC